MSWSMGVWEHRLYIFLNSFEIYNCIYIYIYILYLCIHNLYLNWEYLWHYSKVYQHWDHDFLMDNRWLGTMVVDFLPLPWDRQPLRHETLPLDQVDAPGQGGLLQTHLLRHCVAPMYGAHAQCLLRQQVHFLLAEPH